MFEVVRVRRAKKVGLAPQEAGWGSWTWQGLLAQFLWHQSPYTHACTPVASSTQTLTISLQSSL